MIASVTRRARSAAPLFILALVTISGAQTKPTLRPEDYKQWERLVGSQISNDGHWISYGITLVDGDGRLVVKNSDTPQNWTTPNGTLARFSEDSQWVAYLITPPKAVLDALKNAPTGQPAGPRPGGRGPAESAKPPQNKMGLRNLATGEEQIFDGVAEFGFLKDSNHLWMRRPGTGSTSEFVLWALKTGEPLSISNVAGVTTNKPQSLIALTTEAESGHRSVQILDPAHRTLRTVVWSKDPVKSVTFAEKSDELVIMTSREDTKKEGENGVLLVFKDIRAAKLEMKVLDPQKNDALKGLRIVDSSGVQMNETGSAIAFGTQVWKDKAKPDAAPQDKPGVEVWNAKDLRTLPEQKVQAEADRRRAVTWIWRVEDNSLRSFGDGKLQTVEILRDFEHVTIDDPKPYASASTNGFDYRDLWVVNTITGERKKVLEKNHWPEIGRAHV